MYNSYNKLRLNPIGLAKYTQPVGEFELIIYGDSLAADWRHLPFKNSLNLGIGGHTTKQLLLRSSYHLSDCSSEIAIIFAGGNDLKTTISFPQQSGEIVSNAIENLNGIINNINAERIIICTIPQIFRMPMRYYAFNLKESFKAQLEYNELIRKLQTDRIDVLDTYEIFNNETDKDKYSDDGMHINVKGYELLNKYLFSILNKDSLSN